ncbi:mannosyltransferase [Blastocladiella emersonii ATCC 22665]|nr:mannosyltransferase [Blastocladiella emersonii ATCC 22665]
MKLRKPGATRAGISPAAPSAPPPKRAPLHPHTLPASPAWILAATLLLAIRILGAVSSPITDCDETFNYWEPTHLLTARTHALQTWEYAPQFALRSWAYLLPHAGVARAVVALGGSRFDAFVAVRLVLALASAAAELALARAVVHLAALRKPRGFPAEGLGTALVLVLATAPGMFHSAPAHLPSSFAMVCTTWALTGWARSEYQHYLGPGPPPSRDTPVPPPTQASLTPPASALVIGAVATGSLLGWPFAAVLGVPYALSTVSASWAHFAHFLRLSAIFAAVLLIPAFAIDSYLYSRPVLAFANQVLYNVLRNESARYGVEPWHYYAKNLALNWTLGVPLALLAIFWTTQRRRALVATERGPAAMLILWLAIFAMQPHKEERFLAPVYPALAVLAAHGVVALPRNWLRVAAVAAMAGLGAMRISALIHYYGAPVHLDVSRVPVYGEVGEDANVCLGNDWFLAPGHFLLPDAARLKFVKQGFTGHLPAEFATTDAGSLREVTARVGHAGFNDRNEMDKSRFIPADSCDYILGRDPVLPLSSSTSASAAPLVCERMLAADRTPVWARVLYLPFSLLTPYQAWDEYCLLQVLRPGETVQFASIFDL